MAQEGCPSEWELRAKNQWGVPLFPPPSLSLSFSSPLYPHPSNPPLQTPLIPAQPLKEGLEERWMDEGERGKKGEKSLQIRDFLSSALTSTLSNIAIIHLKKTRKINNLKTESVCFLCDGTVWECFNSCAHQNVATK